MSIKRNILSVVVALLMVVLLASCGKTEKSFEVIFKD